MLKILTIVILVTFSSTIIKCFSHTNQYANVLTTIDTIAKTKSNIIYGKYLWLLEDYELFMRQMTLRSPSFTLKEAHNLKFYSQWVVDSSSRISFNVINENCDISPIEWRIIVSFLNTTTGDTVFSKWTTNFFNETLHKTSKGYSIALFQNMPVSQFNSDFPKERQVDLPILIEVWAFSNILNQIQPKPNFPTSDTAIYGRDLLSANTIKNTCDYVINFNENKKQYCFHKLILQYKAPELYTELNKHAILQSNNSKYVTVFHTNAMTMDSFEKLIEFIYTNVAPEFTTISELKELIGAAVRYKLLDMERVYLERASKYVTVVDVIDWLQFAVENNVITLKDLVLRFLRANAMIITSDSWDNIMKKYVEFQPKNVQ